MDCENTYGRRPHRKGLCKVIPIQCGLCWTNRIPALHFCYRCFPGITVNQIIKTPADGGKIDFQCKICFTRRSTSTEICILREPLLNDPEGASGLNWYIPTPAPSADHQRTPLSTRGQEV